MPRNGISRASFVTRRRNQLGKLDALRLAFVAIAEPCAREPRIYGDTKYGARAPWALLMRYIRQAFDACRSREARRECIERATAFFMACIAEVRLWALDIPQCRRDVFETAQDADGDEDVAESVYLMEPTPANAARLIEVARTDRLRSEARELHLMRIVSGSDRPAA